MYGDTLLIDTKSRRNAKKILNSRPIMRELMVKKGGIIAIGGISGTQKSETAHELAKSLISLGYNTHILSGDDYYTTLWSNRNDERKKRGYKIGINEWDWKRLDWTIETFKNPMYSQIQFYQMSKFTRGIINSYLDKSMCSFLIIEGLYACSINAANLKVHIGSCDPESTYTFRKKRKKENETSPFRKKVVEVECKAVEKLKLKADLIL